MEINKKYLEDFKGIREYLTEEEVKEEVINYIELNLSVKNEDYFKEIYESFLNQIK